MRSGPALSLALCLLLVVSPGGTEGRKCRRRKGGGGKRCERREALRAAKSSSRSAGDAVTSEPTGLSDTPPAKVGPTLSPSSQPPSWRSRPPRDTLLIQREGSEAVFKCKAAGKPRPKVKWVKDGKQMRIKKNKKYRKSKWKLQISQLTISDSGNYTCEIDNAAGHLEWTYTLRVLENKPISDINILERPKNQTAQVGDSVTFMCRSDTWPAPSVHWARKTSSSFVMEIIQMENNTLAEVLVVHNVSKKDAGDYTCYIGNDHSNLQLTATLTVIEEGESLPFEPKCALHVRRQVLVDNTWGCQTMEPVELTYCMGSCGRSYFVPTMLTTDDTNMQANHLNQTCQCCVGVVHGIRIVPLKCPLGDTRRGFFTLLQDCRCQSCALGGEMLKRQSDNNTVSLSP